MLTEKQDSEDVPQQVDAQVEQGAGADKVVHATSFRRRKARFCVLALVLSGLVAVLITKIALLSGGHRYTCQSDTDEELDLHYEPVHHEGFELIGKLIDSENEVYEIKVTIPGDPEKVLKFYLEATIASQPYLEMSVVNNFTLSDSEEQELLEFAGVVQDQPVDGEKQRKHYALVYTALVYLATAPVDLVISNETLAMFQPSAERRRMRMRVLQTPGNEGATQIPWLQQFTAEFSTRREPDVSVQALVGDPSNGCPGRCGGGCSSSDCVAFKDCFDHDMCLKYARVTGWGAYSPFNRDCGGEWVEAADDYFASTLINLGTNTCA